MTYENDPTGRNRIQTDQTGYTGWIVGGVIAFAVIIGLFALFGRNQTNTASNDANRPAATAPATTGSGTANTPVNVPTPPAKPAAPANR
jgi:hypothetical protein